jgi:nucleoside phosphorylase
MIAQVPPIIYVSELCKSETGYWFMEKTPRGLAGRCLLDAIEYLRTAPKYPERFWHVVNAHAIRLVHRCLVDPSLNRGDVLDRMARHMEETCRQLVRSRQTEVPFYGDDYWDWASVINALFEVRKVSRRANEVADDELNQFLKAVQDRLPEGLSIDDPEREWYGPAMAALAYRVMDKHVDKDTGGLGAVLDQLKAQALEKIEDESGVYTYHGRKVSPRHLLWHYGQVVAQFGMGAAVQAERLKDFSWLDDHMEKSERVFILARVLQGSYTAKDKFTIARALKELYGCENLDRPLGQGLMGDTVKGSLNVLDALWPNLEKEDKTRITSMLDALLEQYYKANTVGFVLAIDHEMDTILQEFGANARFEKKEDSLAIVIHPKFRAVIVKGKSLGDVLNATTIAIKEHGAKCVIMPGIAGSLGQSVEDPTDGVKFIGPDKGDVVVATSLAPYRIREKVREEIQNANVPFDGSAWMIIPVDPQLFRLAHKAAESLSKELRVFFEGMIVTGRGIMDSQEGKADVLKKFPGGLAIEEEGYMMGIVCLSHGVPYLNIRAISDRAEGDKIKQQQNTNVETVEQLVAARSASKLAIKVAELLSQQW